MAPITVLAALTMTIGLWPEPFVDFAFKAADELIDPERYIREVLGARP
jgi:multicomponent Na+:H+ antiporter subunit D